VLKNSMKSTIIKWLFGEPVIRDYSSVSIASDIWEHVYLKVENDFIDVSTQQWLLSLDPVVMGIWSNKNAFNLPGTGIYKLYFTDRASSGNDVKKNAVAEVDLELFDKIGEHGGSLNLFRAKASCIYNISQLKISMLFYKFYKKPKLTFDHFKSLVATHSYPRRVRLISFRDGDYYNIFPMDLLGDLENENRFVFGLRHSNHSLPKIISTRKIVVSEFPAHCKNIVYQLGKHHTSQPLSMDSLPFASVKTEKFQFDVPEWVESYKEISILKTLNLGSHMLLWGEPVNEKRFKPPAAHLFHIPFLLHLRRKKFGDEYENA